MRNQEERFNINRRAFLSRSTCASLGLTSLVHTLAQLRVISAFASGDDAAYWTDYRALVCIFLRGGCDMNNVVIPVASNPQAPVYASNRGVVGVPNGHSTAQNPGGTNTTVPISPAGQPANYWGLHPSLVNMGNMFNTGELCFITNCGTLATPVSPADYGSNILPIQLFSHSDQVTQWMAGSAPESPFTSGWGGRVANTVNALNQHSNASMLITVAGNNDFLIAPGGGIPQYSVTTTGAIALVGYTGTPPGPYGGALTDPKDPTSYTNSTTGRRLMAFQDIMNYTHDHILEEGYNTVVRRARESEALVGEALAAAAPANTGVDLDAIWTSFNANNNVGSELKMVAQLIAGRKPLGNQKQIFFVDLGGFDTHQDINSDLPTLLTQLDAATGAFNEAMKQFGASTSGDVADFHHNMVTTFEASDFNRTWTPNGNDAASSGTDHAWGTHVFCFGGAVNGGKLYGQIPTLQVGGPNDVPQGTRGRWIPTTAVDQYSSVLAEWFGVAPGDLNTVFPNLGNFTPPSNPAANLDFMNLV